MPEADRVQKLRALLASAGSARTLERLLGRRLTPEERAALRRVRGSTSFADYRAARTAQHASVERQACADPHRRATLEAKPDEWLRWYLPDAYSLPFERPHREIVAGALRALEQGGRYCVAAERGIGKSALLWGLVLWAVCAGRSRFPAIIAWSERAAKRALTFWKNALSFNERIAADYPDFAAPFVHGRGIAQKVATTWWADTGEATNAALRISEGMIQLPDNRGGLGSGSIAGNVRGLNLPLPNGELLRPTLILVDDVQDRDVARSPSRVREVIERIEQDIAGLGAAGRNTPILLAVNCIEPDDVAAHFLASPTWKATRVPCVIRWPAGFFDPTSECRKLWDRWHELRMNDAEAEATDLLLRNREVMGRDFEPSAPSFLARDGCDPVEAVMAMYYQMGHDAFFAERQQEPQRHEDIADSPRLTRDLLARKVASGPPLEVPPWAALVIASTDINPSYALTTVVVAFGTDQTARVIWHAIRPLEISDKASPVQRVRAIYGALTAHGRELAHAVPRLHAWAIDAGGANFDIVTRFADASPRVARARVLAMTGRASHRYIATGRSVLAGDIREHCHGCAEVKHGRTIRWVAWDADYWAEQMQRAICAEPEAPGGLMFARGDNRDVFDQVLTVRLAGKAEIAGRATYRWIESPGKHDYHDALAQAYAAAAYVGIGTMRRVVRRYRETRKARYTGD